jgi:FixJ family two-component response regulator
MQIEQTVFVVDDEPGIRKLVTALLEPEGIRCVQYGSGRAFLAEAQVQGASCLVLDIRLQDMSGVDLLREVQARPELKMPVIILSATGDVSTVVSTMKLGVHEFLQKPIKSEQLLSQTREALLIDAAFRAQAKRMESVQGRLALLTEREHEVLRLLCEGKSSKQMSTVLNISVKTVAIHRWHMMKKLQVASATEAVHLAHNVGY